jgi:hypothetical protein
MTVKTLTHPRTKTWQDAASLPDVQALIVAWRAYKAGEARYRADVAKRVSIILEILGAEETKTVIMKSLRIKGQTAGSLVNWGQLFIKVPDIEVWRITDIKGVTMLAAAKQAVRKKVVECMMKLAVEIQKEFGEAYIDSCYIQKKLANFGDPIAADAAACAKKAKRMGMGDTIKALKEARDALARHPFLEQEFSMETLSLLKSLS